jgi:hypothetical protein
MAGVNDGDTVPRLTGLLAGMGPDVQTRSNWGHLARSPTGRRLPARPWRPGQVLEEAATFA